MKFKLAFVLALAAAVLAGPRHSHAQIVGSDDFDGGGEFLTRTIDPDNSANGGTFSSIFDVFGIVNREVNNDFADNTLMDETFFGLVPSTKTDLFFGTEDIDNNDNPDGTGTLVYTFDISGQSDLMLSAEFSARGNFESANDINTVTASIDGGAEQLLFDLIVEEGTTLTYTYESGATEDIIDPMTIQGTALNNTFQVFSAAISGTGSTLTVTFNFAGNGGGETLAIDNILVEGGGGGECNFPLGDVNQDGSVALSDIPFFVNQLSNGGNQCEADIDQNGTVELADIPLFVDLLAGG